MPLRELLAPGYLAPTSPNAGSFGGLGASGMVRKVRTFPQSARRRKIAERPCEASIVVVLTSLALADGSELS